MQTIVSVFKTELYKHMEEGKQGQALKGSVYELVWLESPKVGMAHRTSSKET